MIHRYPVDLEIQPRRFQKSTKQLSTLGPASSTLEMIEKLFLSGTDIFRINFSHGEHSEKAKLVNFIRDIETKYEHPIAILADLQGPKLRVQKNKHAIISNLTCIVFSTIVYY